MRFLLYLTILSATLLLCSCGHNSVVYGDGLAFETTFNPQTFAFGVSIRYGKILTAAVKEKSKLTFKGEITSKTDGASKAESTVKTGAEITLETGDQVTGYAVDLEKAKQDSPKT